MSLAVTLLFSFGTWRGRGGETCKTGRRETTVCRRGWAAQAGKVILQLQTQSISPWHPVGADGSQRRQPASLPLEASSHTALSVAPRVQGPSSTPASPGAELPPRRPRPRASWAISLMPAHLWGFFAQPLSWEQAGRSGRMGLRRAGLGQLPRVTARPPPSQQKGTG